MTGFVYSENYLNHITGPGHPESPNRLKVIADFVKDQKYWSSLYHISPKPAKVEILRLIHPDSYIKYVRAACEREIPCLDFGDTRICYDSYATALLAVGGVLQAVDVVFHDEIQNVFCAIRPPGHHAESDSAMGFCLFNNIAIAAKYAQEKYQIGKVFILDWDVHHGNGTQHIFESDPSVYYLSLHQYPFYPGTGGIEETGKGDGLGTTRNFPLIAGKGDREYMDIFEHILPDIIIKFAPSLILISAGFDAHYKDPLASMNVSTKSFSRMTEIIVTLSKEVCGGKLISILEGGYNCDALKKCVDKHLKMLQEVEVE